MEQRPSPTTDHDPRLDVIVVVDMANLMGSRPDGWWRDRKAAATRLLTALTSLVGADATGPGGEKPFKIGIVGIVAVLEGPARGATGPGVQPVGTLSELTSSVVVGNGDGPDRPAVQVVDAERDGDSAIVTATENLFATTTPSDGTDRVRAVLVVTADRGLRLRLPPGTMIAGPDWLNRLIGR